MYDIVPDCTTSSTYRRVIKLPLTNTSEGFVSLQELQRSHHDARDIVFHGKTVRSYTLRPSSVWPNFIARTDLYVTESVKAPRADGKHKGPVARSPRSNLCGDTARPLVLTKTISNLPQIIAKIMQWKQSQVPMSQVPILTTLNDRCRQSCLKLKPTPSISHDI